MNVSTLRKALQELEAKGLGNLKVGLRECICHDMDSSINTAGINAVVVSFVFDDECHPLDAFKAGDQYIELTF